MKYKCLEKLVGNNKKSGKFIRFLNKVLMAILLGLVSLIVMEYSPKFKTFMNENVLGKDFSFAYLDKLYQKVFGKVLPQKEQNTVVVFNEKLEYLSKEAYKEGQKLTVNSNYLVPNLVSGIVVFVGEREDMGKVVTIEGEDDSTITYGNIKNTDLKLYDHLDKGKFLGEVSGETLYLTILKKGEYLDIETYLSQ